MVRQNLLDLSQVGPFGSDAPGNGPSSKGGKQPFCHPTNAAPLSRKLLLGARHPFPTQCVSALLPDTPRVSAIYVS